MCINRDVQQSQKEVEEIISRLSQQKVLRHHQTYVITHVDTGRADGARHHERWHDPAQHRIGTRSDITLAITPHIHSPSSSSKALPCSHPSRPSRAAPPGTSTPRCATSHQHIAHTKATGRARVYAAALQKARVSRGHRCATQQWRVSSTFFPCRQRFQPGGAAGAPRQRGQWHPSRKRTQVVPNSCLTNYINRAHASKALITQQSCSQRLHLQHKLVHLGQKQLRRVNVHAIASPLKRHRAPMGTMAAAACKEASLRSPSSPRHISTGREMPPGSSQSLSSPAAWIGVSERHTQ